MCCTLEPARLSNTILYAAEVMHPTLHRPVHVLGYGNNAESAGPNAMLLPIPSRAHMGPENVLDTTNTKHLLKDLAEAIKPKTVSESDSLSDADDSLDHDRSIQIFDAGSYTVVLAKDASAIPSVLRFVPSAKRPKVNQAIFDCYAAFYPNAQFALCCWNGKVNGDKAEPLLWWYEPSDSSSLFLPGLDAHDGRPPVLTNQVRVDHTLIVSTNMRSMSDGDFAYFRDNVTDLRPFLPPTFSGIELEGMFSNGDWRFPIRNFSKLSWAGSQENVRFFERLPPPSA